MIRALVLAGVVVAWPRVPGGRRAWLVVLVVGLWSLPLAAAAVGVGVGLRHVRPLWHRRRQQQAAQRELVLLGELVALGLGSGLPFLTALDTAAHELSTGLRREVEDVLRVARRRGSAAALAAGGGTARRLYVLAARASATGAPLRDAVEAFVEEARTQRRVALAAAARRLPVLLTFPLALLILPGFVLLTVAPAFVGALERIGT